MNTLRISKDFFVLVRQYGTAQASPSTKGTFFYMSDDAEELHKLLEDMGSNCDDSWGCKTLAHNLPPRNEEVSE